MPKLAGRNDLCRCESGLKYKRCHLEWDRQGISPDVQRADAGAAGTLAGYNVILLGERPNPGAMQDWSVPGGTIRTDDPSAVFEARVAAFSLDSVIDLAATLTRRFWTDRKTLDRDIRQAGYSPHSVFLPFLIRRLVTQAIARRILPDTVTTQINGDWFAKSERVLADVASLSDHKRAGGFATESVAMRTVQAQYHDQLDYHTYGRELWLNLGTVSACLEDGIDLDAMYRDTFGLSYSELAVLAFGAYATIIEGNGVIDPANWNVGGVVDVPPGTVDAFFRLSGATYADFQIAAADPRFTEPGFEPYAFSPLIQTPLILRNVGTYVAPVARDILERPTVGFAIDALQATEHAPAAGGTLRRVSGRVYEDYVFRSLDLASGSGKVRRGNDVLSVDELNCDFVCEEPMGTTLVEAKSVRLRLRVEMTKERDILKTEMKEKGLGHGLAQLDASSVRLRDGDADLASDIPAIGVLVVRGELVFVNSDLFRSILEELAEEELGRKVTLRYQVTNDEGFDLLVRRLAAGHSLFEFLSNKEANPQVRREDMHHTVVSETRGLAEHPLRAEQIAARTALYERHLLKPTSGPASP